MPASVPGHGRETLRAAADHIQIAVDDAGRPIDQLGAAIGRMSARVLSDAGDHGIDVDGLRRDLNACIENLQVFDRLVQHLQLIRKMLMEADAEAGRIHGEAAAWLQAHERPAEKDAGAIELF